ncbi:hypothetical protein LZZ85_03425 [Terrimonas sp. NA20]|uniref:Uncharacterized protein n=1 Tax=Terrimonas ginsenosidimutans TaxID=2908004 RepID=A0ABS9KLW2_9BACT|nr:hypothetical protein [Terrimonas ginsenosidimutans]MCG2613310.1 hypothetical protein [Terrimonas ginsenosidimutans]
MYKLIKDLRDLDTLRIGDLLIQYPLSGCPAETIDLSVPENFALYQIASAGSVKLRLLLRQDIADTPAAAPNPSEDLRSAAVSIVVEKLTYALVKEKNWWRQ